MPLVKKTPLAAAPTAAPDWGAQVNLLQNGTADQRWAAARALGQVPQAVDDLDAALAGTADPRLQEAIFTSLAQQNSAAAYDVLLRHLRSDDAERRSLALDAMRLMPEQIMQCLPALLADEDPDIRVLASELARQMPPAEAALLLAGLLETEPEANVCAAVIEVLAEIGGTLELSRIAACAGRFPSEFFLNFSAETAAERIRARIGS